MAEILAGLPLALASVALVATAASVAFRFIEPRYVEADYDGCHERWHEAVLATCGGRPCEEGLCRVPQQPVNTYSNLLYLVAGVLVAGGWPSAPAALFAVALGHLCVGSMLYHAISTNWAHVLDETGIYSTYGVLAGYAVATLVGLEGGWALALMAAVACGAVGVFGPRFQRPAPDEHTPLQFPHRDLVVAVLLIPAALLPLLAWRETWPLVVAAVGLFAAARVVWVLDRRRRIPLLGGRAWGHGLWHLLTAPATALVFLSIRAWAAA